MTRPLVRRLGLVGGRRGPQLYRVSQCVGDRHTADVTADRIAAVVSSWLAELGADSPVVADLARAVRAGDWHTAHALAEYLSVEVRISALPPAEKL